MPDEPLTILISDMEGSTAFTAAKGDETALEVIRTHERLTREVVLTHGGREIKSMGDGFMLAFTSPSTAVACALDLQAALEKHNADHPEHPLRVRIGLNAGPVIEEGGDLYGTTVNVASRIAAKARAGQVLVSEGVHELSDGDWTFIDRGLFWLKGLRERWRLFEPTRGPVTIDLTSIQEERTPFVDREDERAALRLYVDAAMEGRGGFVFLSGDSGAGKTRLAEVVGAEAAARGMRMFIGRCYDATRTHPFAPLIDVLERIEAQSSPLEFRVLLAEAAGEIARLLPHVRRRYPDVPPPADLHPERERRYLFASLRDVLARVAREQPLFLILDDIHWADEASLLFLEQLAPNVQDLPILLVATYTHSELAASRPLQGALERLHRSGEVDRLALGALGEDDVRDLLRAIARTEPPDAVVRLLHSETEGNAFFLAELIRHLTERGRLIDADGGFVDDAAGRDVDVPENVRLTIRRRLDGLTRSTCAILANAALIGRGFALELLEATAQTTEDTLLDALDEAERSQLVTSAIEAGVIRFTFAHELIRQTLIADISLARRQILHLTIADAIEQIFASRLTDHAADLAYHLTEAGRRASPVRTAAACVMAGERAHDAAAYEEALRHFDHALSLIPQNDEASRASILVKVGRAELSSGHPDDALATWNEALDAYDALGDNESVARLSLDACIQISWWIGRRDIGTLIERGLHAVGERDSASREGLLAMSGVMASHLGSYREAEDKLDFALDLARKHEDTRVLGLVLFTKTAHHFNYLEHERAVEVGREAIEHLRAAGDLWNLANVQGFVGQSLGFLGRFDEAAEATEGAKDLAERLGNWVAYVYIDRARAWRHMSLHPDPEQLDRDGIRDVELGTNLGYGWMCSLGYTRRSFAAFVKGRWDDALTFADRSSSYERGVGHGHLGRLVLLNAYLGDREASIAAFERLRPLFPQANDPSYVGMWDSFLAAIEGMAVLGERERVADLYEVAVEAQRWAKLFRGWDYRLISSVVGMAATCAGRWDEAEEYFKKAVDIADGLPYPLEQPEARRFYAWMLLQRARNGDHDRACRLLDEAIGGYQRIGMPAHEALARSMLAQTA